MFRSLISWCLFSYCSVFSFSQTLYSAAPSPTSLGTFVFLDEESREKEDEEDALSLDDPLDLHPCMLQANPEGRVLGIGRRKSICLGVVRAFSENSCTPTMSSTFYAKARICSALRDGFFGRCNASSVVNKQLLAAYPNARPPEVTFNIYHSIELAKFRLCRAMQTIVSSSGEFTASLDANPIPRIMHIRYSEWPRGHNLHMDLVTRSVVHPSHPLYPRFVSILDNGQIPFTRSLNQAHQTKDELVLSMMKGLARRDRSPREEHWLLSSLRVGFQTVGYDGLEEFARRQLGRAGQERTENLKRNFTAFKKRWTD